MTEHETEHEPLLQKPLPQVDMPLFRDDIRRGKVRILLWVVGLLLGGVLFTVGFYLRPLIFGESSSQNNSGTVPLASGETELALPEHPEEAAAPAAPSPTAADSVATRAGLATVAQPNALVLPGAAATAPTLSGHGLELQIAGRSVHLFGNATGFVPALIAAGCTRQEAEQITAAFANIVDFRRCRPQHELVLQRLPDGSLSRFEYHASLTQSFEAVRNARGTFTGRQMEVPIERSRVVKAGVVHQSLGASLEEQGLGRTLVGVFVETFERRIDFSREARVGDSFRILVEEERVHGQFLRYGTVYAIEYRSQGKGLLRAYWYGARAEQGRGEQGDFYDENGRALTGGVMRTPLRYDFISSPFNPRRMHPVLRRVVPHNGVDYAAAHGTPIWATGAGSVTFVGPRGPNGNLVTIRHDGGYESMYCHLSRFASGLRVGQRVDQREVIGYVGSTGRSTGPHLHFGMKRGGNFVDPIPVLNGPGRALAGGQLAAFRNEMARYQREMSRTPLPEMQPVNAGASVAPPPANDHHFDE